MDVLVSPRVQEWTKLGRYTEELFSKIIQHKKLLGGRNKNILIVAWMNCVILLIW